MEKISINVDSFSFLTEKELEKIDYNLRIVDKQKKVIMITSSVPKEGKSTIAFGIGKQLVKSKRSILYVANELPSWLGVSVSESHVCETDIEGFDLLISPETEIVLSEYKEKYDYVLIDMPALYVAKNAILYTNICDLILLVVEANRCSKKEILGCKEELSVGVCKDIRVILNKTKKSYGVLRNRKK
ncbi:hypothetical protein JQM69_08460 [Faecalicatena contorta]|uniref:hypothetical protein n=1 Tax=Faecalicatena contorta TaxID=39482 RepID=UPI001F3AD939|nr:hypothetical protein [Faecalicatena contorta]MCF2680721.1 hypothetical protein [Faecalicatena contorta]